MNDPVEWIAANALMVWAMLLLLAMLIGDLAWHWNQRQREAAMAAGRVPVAVRGPTVLLLLLAMLLLFGAIALALKEEATRWLPEFDMALAQSLNARMGAGTLRLVAAVSHLGDQGTVTMLTVIVLAVLLLRRRLHLATCWALTMAGVVPLNSGLKELFQRPRPLHNHGFMVEQGWSFPSGHAFGAMVFYGMLAYVLLRVLPHRWHRAVVAGAIVMVTVIGISRIVLQVHYFTDVLAGYASGLAWLLLCIAGAEAWRMRRAPSV